MPKLPLPPTDELVKVFEYCGWAIDRQEGSHIIMEKDGSSRPLVIPVVKDRVSHTVLNSNLRTAGITRAEFQRIRNKI